MQCAGEIVRFTLHPAGANSIRAISAAQGINWQVMVVKIIGFIADISVDQKIFKDKKLRLCRVFSGNVLHRINRLAEASYFEMQLDAVGVTIAHFGNFLSLGDVLAFLDQDLAVVSVGA